MTEKDLEKNLGERIKKLGGLSLKWVNPWFTGVPDRIVLLPRRRIFFVELKSPNGKLTARQKMVHGILAAMGWPVTVIYNLEDLNAFCEMLGPKQESDNQVGGAVSRIDRRTILIHSENGVDEVYTLVQLKRKPDGK